MPTVENTGSYIKRYNFWNPATWTIPSLYWDTFSQEQRIHAICRQLSKVIQYADYLGVNTDDVVARLKAIEDGQLDEFIVAAIEEWFEDNQPAIVQAIETLQTQTADLENIIPSSDFDNVNTVKKYIDDSVSTINADISDIEAIIPSTDFTSASTVKDAIDAVASNVTDIADIIPSTDFTSASTVKDAIDAVASDVTDLAAIIPSTDFTSASTVKDAIDAINAAAVNIVDRNANVILIGDSYLHMNNTKPTIGNALISLMSNWNIYNAADGGSGFTFGGEDGRTFEQQFEYAKTHFADFNNTDAVLVIGGRNEAGGLYSPHYPSSGLYNAVDSCVADIHTSLPNAKVYIFPCLFDWVMPNSNLKAVINTIEQVAYKYHDFCARGCWSWGTGHEADLYNGGNDIHPNAQGCALFAGYIVDAIKRNREYCWINRTVHLGSDNSNYHLDVYTQEDNICMQGGWEQNNAASGGNRICYPSDLPTWMDWVNRSGNRYDIMIGYGICRNSSSGVAGNNGVQCVMYGQYGLTVGQGVETRNNAVMPDGFEIRIQSCQSVFFMN